MSDEHDQLASAEVVEALRMELDVDAYPRPYFLDGRLAEIPSSYEVSSEESPDFGEDWYLPFGPPTQLPTNRQARVDQYLKSHDDMWRPIWHLSGTVRSESGDWVFRRQGVGREAIPGPDCAANTISLNKDDLPLPIRGCSWRALLNGNTARVPVSHLLQHLWDALKHRRFFPGGDYSSFTEEQRHEAGYAEASEFVRALLGPHPVAALCVFAMATRFSSWFLEQGPDCAYLIYHAEECWTAIFCYTDLVS